MIAPQRKRTTSKHKRHPTTLGEHRTNSTTIKSLTVKGPCLSNSYVSGKGDNYGSAAVAILKSYPTNDFELLQRTRYRTLVVSLVRGILPAGIRRMAGSRSRCTIQIDRDSKCGAISPFSHSGFNLMLTQRSTLRMPDQSPGKKELLGQARHRQQLMLSSLKFDW